MTRRIKKVAIIGSGIMGSGIACHFANIGVEVLLLDIVPRELNDKEKAKGLSLEDSVVRNRLVNDALMTSLKSKPSPIYSKKFADRIVTGNLEDDLHKIKDVDWVMEVVVERLDIKQQVFEKIEKYRTPGTLITSNTTAPLRDVIRPTFDGYLGISFLWISKKIPSEFNFDFSKSSFCIDKPIPLRNILLTISWYLPFAG